MAAHTILDDRDKRELQNSINLARQKLQNDIDTYKQETDEAIADLREHTDSADQALKENLDSVELDLQTQINDNKAELQAEIDTNAADIATNRESIDLNRTTLLNNKKELQKNIDTLEAETLEGFREVNEGLSTTKKKLEQDLANHNVSSTCHSDIRSLIQGLTNRLNTLADSDDTTLDQLSEIVAYIKNNKDLIDGITTNKINFTDIVDNLATNSSGKVLSAAQGVVLKAMFDSIPSWSMQDEKPKYTPIEVGADASGTAANAVDEHNTSSTCHKDIRDGMKKFQEDIDSLGQVKIDKEKIYDNLDCDNDGYVLDAKQGAVIKGMMDDISTEVENIKAQQGAASPWEKIAEQVVTIGASSATYYVYTFNGVMYWVPQDKLSYSGKFAFDSFHLPDGYDSAYGKVYANIVSSHDKVDGYEVYVDVSYTKTGNPIGTSPNAVIITVTTTVPEGTMAMGFGYDMPVFSMPVVKTSDTSTDS